MNKEAWGPRLSLQPGDRAVLALFTRKVQAMWKIIGIGGAIALITLLATLGWRHQAQGDANVRGHIIVTSPEFAQGTQWLQSKPVTIASLRGQVVVVHFWTFGCVNCVHNYPVYKAWQEKYAGKGVTIIGIHRPEFTFEADVKEVQAKAEKNGLKFPIAIDNDGTNWKNWDNHYWPSIYLIDKKGQVRYRWEGELHLETTQGRRFAQRIVLAEKP
jgi:thiol-disulfide isomerase/thioredoxin